MNLGDMVLHESDGKLHKIIRIEPAETHYLPYGVIFQEPKRYYLKGIKEPVEEYENDNV